MSLLGTVKRLINNSFRAIGYEIVPYVKEKEGEWKVDDAIAHNTLENIEQWYGRENFLETYIGHARLKFYDYITGFIKSKGIHFDGKTVVDVGSGTGHLLAFLHDKAGLATGTGLEYSKEAIRIAQKLFPNLEFHQYDINNPWRQSYDVVFCTEVLEHLLHPNVGLKNVIDMINPGGSALITVPNGRTDTFGGHINFWSPESWKVFIQSNVTGCEIETGTMSDNHMNYALIKKTA